MTTLQLKVYLAFLFMLISPFSMADQTMRGKMLYEQSCMVCHGEDGTGAMPGVLDLTEAKGPMNHRDEQLVKSISEGVNREGAVMAMPPKGGNPQLSDDDIKNIIKHMRQTF